MGKNAEKVKVLETGRGNGFLTKHLADSGFEQSKKFSWDKCAKIMLETIRNDGY